MQLNPHYAELKDVYKRQICRGRRPRRPGSAVATITPLQIGTVNKNGAARGRPIVIKDVYKRQV